jgi:molybdate transport system substrate-binding protein
LHLTRSLQRRAVFVLAAAALALPARPARSRGVPRIAAAADLKFALEEIAREFRQETGQAVEPIFGSSGNLVRQILQGAPFELLLSADEGFVFRLADAGLTLDRGELYAVGRIVLFAPHGSPLVPDPELRGLAAALAEDRIRRFAIANPEHAPYGRAAREALQSYRLWDAIRPRLVLGENAAQAMQFASAGSAEGGIVPYSLSLAPAVAAQGSFALIPDTRHAPLRQRMVLTTSAGAVARAFYRHLQAPRAREVFRRWGFVLPGEV